MNLALQIFLFAALAFWPLSLFISVMGFAAPGSMDNQKLLISTILFLMYPIYLFIFLTLFNKSFLGLKSPLHLVVVSLIVLSGISYFGYFRYLKNTFYQVSNTGWAVVDEKVFYSGRQLPQVDAQNFQIIKGFGAELYATDGKNVYFRHHPITDADPDSFEMFEHKEWKKSGHFFTYDKHRVYHFDKVIEGADPQSFEVLDNINAQDKNHQYKEHRQVKSR